jgi:outer membrane protein assembly factor BamB
VAASFVFPNRFTFIPFKILEMFIMHQRFLSILWLVLILSFPALAAGPIGWRTNGDGRYLDADPPTHWSPGSNVAWKTKMPSWSNASPVLSPDGALIFVCSEPNQLLAVDRALGKIVWQASVQDVEKGNKPKTHEANGYTSPTPITDGKHVFVVFGSGVVAAYTLKGERVWARYVEKPAHDWGNSASPALGGGRLIVHISDLIGLDPASGKEMWRAVSQEKFGSPVVTQVGDTDIVITPTGDVFRAADGKALASEVGKLEFATPVVQDGIVYFIEKKATALKLPEALGDTFQGEELWVGRANGSRHYASSVIHDGLIYAVSRGEKFSVLEATSGALVYEKQLDIGEGGNSAYASVTLAGDKLFVGAENGTTVVLALGRQYREIARNKVEGFRSSPVFVGGLMYLRAFDYLYCLKEEGR